MHDSPEREDLLSIVRGLRPYYFWVFVIQLVAWAALVIWLESTGGEHDGVPAYAVAVGTQMAQLTLASLAATVILVDIGRYIRRNLVVFLPDPIIKVRAKARAEGRAEGIAEGRAKGRAEGIAEGIAKARAERRAERDLEWRAYIREMLEAIRRGEDFDKPSPDEKD